MADVFGDLNPPQRLLMGPGLANAHPRVLRAMSADLLGQFDPEMTAFCRHNPWTSLLAVADSNGFADSPFSQVFLMANVVGRSH